MQILLPWDSEIGMSKQFFICFGYDLGTPNRHNLIPAWQMSQRTRDVPSSFTAERRKPAATAVFEHKVAVTAAWERFSSEAASIRMPRSKSCGTAGAAASAVSEDLPRSLCADERAVPRFILFRAAVETVETNNRPCD